jgi:hypothetical protein
MQVDLQFVAQCGDGIDDVPLVLEQVQRGDAQQAHRRGQCGPVTTGCCGKGRWYGVVDERRAGDRRHLAAH